MTTRKAIRADLVSVLGNVTYTGTGGAATLRALGYLPDSVPAPCATVSYREMDPRLVFTGAKATYPLTVRLWTSRTEERTAQDLLDDWCELTGATSVVAAIQTSANWSETIDYAEVVLIGQVQEEARADEVFLVVDIDVEIVW